MHRQFLVFLAVLFSSVLLAGCGTGSSLNSGGTNGSGSTNPSVALSSSKGAINPGDVITLTWAAQNANTFVSSNFGAAAASGSIQVSPAATTEFFVTVSGSGQSVTSKTTVTVNNKARFVLVGNPTAAGVSDLQSLLTTIGTVAVQADIPAPSADFDAVVLHQSGNLTTTTAPKVQALVDASKGVVVVGWAPAPLVGINNPTSQSSVDTSKIASWLGATKLQPGGYIAYDIARSNAGFFALPPGDAGAQVYLGSISGDPWIIPAFLGASDDKVISTSSGNQETLAYAFKPESARVYWQWSTSGQNAQYRDTVIAIFKTGALWAAGQH